MDNLNGMKIGLLKEGFGLPQADPRVDQMVKDTVTKLTEAGATVEEMSIPIHAKGKTYIKIHTQTHAHMHTYTLYLN